MLCEPTTPMPADTHLLQLDHSFPGTANSLGSPLGRSDCLAKLECFRFLPASDPPLGSLELLKFRESGIASEYESNTDESEDWDSWTQEEPLRMANVLDKQGPGDSLDDEIAV